MRKLDFSKASVLVVGDIMLDRYYSGGVSRISPEAPVPVINIESDSRNLGGAGNVVNNIASLKGNCSILGVCRNDEAGATICQMLDDLGVKHEFADNGVPTITKLRIIGGKQQIARLDFEEIKPMTTENMAILKERIARKMKSAQTVVISDYGKGVCNPEICGFIINLASKENKYVIVDPKGSDWSKYNGASIITPNVKELQEVCGYKIANVDNDIITAGTEIRKRYNLKYLVVTRSEKGITIISETGNINIPTQARAVFDVSGAGDTVVAVTALCLASSFGVEDAVTLANSAAGVVVGKLGTAPIFLNELKYAIHGSSGSKLISKSDIEFILSGENKAGKKIVFTNGCFDILHKGHVSYLKQAKKLGDILIIGLNSDGSVKRLKGTERPINNEKDRAFVLDALEAVDYVVIFDEDTPFELIKTIKPDYLVKGGDYKPENVVGKEFAGQVVIIDFVNGYSTTSTIDKMRRN